MFQLFWKLKIAKYLDPWFLPHSKLSQDTSQSGSQCLYNNHMPSWHKKKIAKIRAPPTKSTVLVHSSWQPEMYYLDFRHTHMQAQHIHEELYLHKANSYVRMYGVYSAIMGHKWYTHNSFQLNLYIIMVYIAFPISGDVGYRCTPSFVKRINGFFRIVCWTTLLLLVSRELFSIHHEQSIHGR